MRFIAGFFAVLCAVMPLHARDVMSDAMPQMRASDIVILGEVHDNPIHHAAQGANMQMLRPKAVVFEMLTPEMAALVNAASDKQAPDLGVVIGWEEAGWPDFAIYRNVFGALGDAIVVGAAAPRETVRAAFTEGAAAVFGPGAETFGLDRPLPEEQLVARQKLQFDAHCQAMPMEMMIGMVEAQRLRDAQFADVALKALEAYGPPVVVITGNGHARRDWGIPHSVAVAGPDVQVFSMGALEHPAELDDPRFDVNIVTQPPSQRGDPCAVFKK